MNKMLWGMAVGLTCFSAGGARADVPLTVVAWYPFETGDATDATGNGHDGTMHGDPTPQPGMIGQGLGFDGVDDYISVAHSPSFDTDTLVLLGREQGQAGEER